MSEIRVIAWGGYDDSKPRVRLLLDALRRRGVLGAEIRIAAWLGVEDKSVAGPWRLLKAAFKLLFSYPMALVRLLDQPRRGIVLLPYPGTPDIFLAAPVAKLRGHRIVLDAFLPIHDTIVRDRAMVGAKSWLGRAIWMIERFGLRLADVILVDTEQHGDFFASEFGIERDRFVTVLVGAEPLFGKAPCDAELPPFPADRPVVLFYGQLIPLHGVTTILDAARLTREEPFHWLLVGKGQQEALLRAALDEDGPDNLTWIPWVEYEALPTLIARSAVCLGVFGESDKAGRVIPNKVFQALASGKPVITRSSAAMDPLAARYPDSLMTVPAGDSVALANAACEALSGSKRLRPLSAKAREELSPDEGVDELLRRLASDQRP